MLDWNALIDETALASLLPGEHRAFARPVRDALVTFLDRLDAAHQRLIAAAQMSLPPSATISQRLGRLAQCCPVLQKLGQILARDTRLSLELRIELEQLESLPPSVAWSDIEKSLMAEWGSAESPGLRVMRPAIAEASVAVVIPCQRIQASANGEAELGVLKLLKPHIEERMEQELGMLEEVGAYLDQRCEDLGIPELDYQDAFRQVADKLRHEVRLDQEQRHLADAAVSYRDEPHVQIPHVWNAFCTPRLTAMERVSGGKITDRFPSDGTAQRRLADALTCALIARPIFSRSPTAVFHGDPHAGNLFLTDDGRLALLDWSLIGHLDAQQRAAVMQVLLGGVTQDASRIVSVLTGLGDRRLNSAALSSVVQTGLLRVRQGRFPGLKWLLEMLDEAVAAAGLRVSSDLLLFRKSLYTLDGVVRKIGGPEFQMDEVLLREFLVQFAVEWPHRWFTLPHTRNFATRLSNWDLTRTVLGMPWTCSRLCLQKALDQMQSQRSAAKVNCS